MPAVCCAKPSSGLAPPPVGNIREAVARTRSLSTASHEPALPGAISPRQPDDLDAHHQSCRWLPHNHDAVSVNYANRVSIPSAGTSGKTHYYKTVTRNCIDLACLRQLYLREFS